MAHPPQPTITIREELCKEDGLCVKLCPVQIFAAREGKVPSVTCDAAMLSIQLLAHAHGIGTCWNGLLQGAAAGDHLRGFTKLAEFLAIPEGHKCYAAATAGYPAVRLHGVPPREVAITWIGA